MVYRKRNYPRRRATTKPRRRKTYSTGKKKVSGLKKMVRREIARNIENKTIQYLGTAYDILPSNSPGFDSNIIPCYPAATYLNIQQGLGQGARIGSKIKIKNLKIDGVLFPLAYNATSNLTPCPSQIKIWWFYDKEEGNSVPQPVASNDFFQFGSGTIGFQNELFDHTMPVNTDRYRILTTRTYKLGYASYQGTGAQPQQGNFSNNDFKLNCRVRVNLTKYCVKHCVFRDNNANPTTRGIYMMAQPVYANGNPMTAATIPARMEYMLTCDFEDA